MIFTRLSAMTGLPLCNHCASGFGIPVADISKLIGVDSYACLSLTSCCVISGGAKYC